MALLCAPVRGIQRGKLLSLRLRERESLFRACYARLSKVVVFCGTFVCTSKGYIERETSPTPLKKEGVTFQGSLCSPLKSGGFLWHFCGTFECTSKGYVVREISLASLERERESLFRARYAHLSKVVVFCGNSVALLFAPVRGM